MNVFAVIHRVSLASLIVIALPGSARAASAPVPATAAEAPSAGSAPAAAAASKPKQPRATLTVPLYSEEHASVPVAKVGSEVVTLQEFVDALASNHEERSGTTRASAEFLPVLERMIELRLVLLDARETGIDQTPSVREAVRGFEETALISMLREEISKDVGADPEEVERLFKERAREWKIRTVLFKVEQDAKEFLRAAAGGEEFDALAKKAVEGKKATAAPEAEYLPREMMLPHLEKAVTDLQVGAVGGPLAVKDGFAVLRIEDVRYPEKPELRARAEAESRTRRRTDAVWKFYVELQKRHLKKLDRALLDRVDFHAAKPGIAALRKDKRVLVAFKDRSEKPLTVGDVADAVERKFFHGTKLAAKEQRINDQKDKVFEGMLMKRLLTKEARARKIQDRFAYKSRVAQYEDSVVFGQFVETVIKPSVRVQDSEVKAHYEESKAEFTNPELFTLDSIAFPNAAKAQVALDKLRAGADFNWMKANGEGIVPEEEQDQELKGRTVTKESMPPALSKALSAARAGEYRLYATPTLCYVLKVVRHTPSTIAPLEAVKTDIIKELFNQNLSKAVKDWASKVREATDVEVFISRLDS